MILIFGPQGSGKGTQAALLASRKGWRWLSTGQMFRDSSDPEVHKRVESGELIDDTLTAKVLDAALADTDRGAKIILDGYPRNADQARWLLENLPKHGRSIACMLELEVPQEESIRRLAARGRADDKPPAINRRLEIYHSETEPVIDFYRQRNIPYHKVSGLGSVEEIYDRIQEVLKVCVPK